MPADDPIARRADVLRRLLGSRAPWLVRWVAALGVALGLGIGVVVWRVFGTRFLLGREILIAVGGLRGFAWGALARTRLGGWLSEAVDSHPPAALPGEFRDLAPRPDPRERTFERHRRL